MGFRIAALIAGLFGLLAIAALGFFMAFYRNKIGPCETAECVKSAARVLHAMDTSVDPCNNFFLYACGGWLRNHPLTTDKASISQFQVANDRSQEVLRDVLGSDYTHDRDALKKAKKYYQACVNEDVLEQKDARPVFDLIEKLGGFPLLGGGIDESDFDLEDYLAKAKTRVGNALAKESSPLININVDVDYKNSTNFIIGADQPLLGLSSHLFYLLDFFAPVQRAYRSFLHDYLELIWESYDRENGLTTFNEKALNDAINEVYRLDENLAAIIEPDQNRQDLDALYNKMTLGDMATEVSADFDWFKYIKKVFAKVDQEVYPSTEVLVTGKPYLSKMMSVLKKFNSSTIQNYVVMYNLAGSLALLPRKYRATNAGLRKAASGTSNETPRWKVCTSKATRMLPFPVGALYVRAAFSKSSKTVILEMIKNVMNSFKNNLVKYEWMDDETMAVAEAKVDAVAQYIGYPDYILDENDPKLDEDSKDFDIFEEEFFKAEFDLRKDEMRKMFRRLDTTVDRSEWPLSPAVMNAFYNPAQNSMIFPSGILQLPFFGPGQNFALNYGAIGTTIGHELTHGFDTRGSTFNAVGNLKDWWSNSSRAAFEDLAQCMRDQYSKFFYEDAEMFVNGDLTITENIADNGGIKSGYRGYQLWRKNNPGREFQLPGLENFTPEQLFFVGYGQVWCSAERPEIAKRTILSDIHSPYVFRVNGVLKNYPEFGKTFGCVKGIDDLYPDPQDTCTVW